MDREREREGQRGIEILIDAYIYIGRGEERKHIEREGVIERQRERARELEGTRERGDEHTSCQVAI